jgi:hypothetical protein
MTEEQFAQFKIELKPLDALSFNGQDSISFLFTANKGAEFKELHKTASGGELSRLMLCLKALLAERTALPTIIFDEIDTGVSGDVANKIGNIESRAGATYPDFKVLYVRKIEGAEIELERNILRKQKQNVDILRNNNWQLSAILNDTEREKMKIERTNQIITLQKKIKKIEHQIKFLSDFGYEIEQFKPYFTKLLNSNFVKKINFKKLVRFKPSMTYIQNIQ